MANKHLLFVYGTLKAGGPLDYALMEMDATFVGQARILSKDFVMVSLGDAYPALFPVRGGQGMYVIGEVYAINPDQLPLTDRIEGYPHHYTRTQCPVFIGCESHTAWVYHYEEAKSSRAGGLKIIHSGEWDAEKGAPVPFTGKTQNPTGQVYVDSGYNHYDQYASYYGLGIKNTGRAHQDDSAEYEAWLEARSESTAEINEMLCMGCEERFDWRKATTFTAPDGSLYCSEECFESGFNGTPGMSKLVECSHCAHRFRSDISYIANDGRQFCTHECYKAAVLEDAETTSFAVEQGIFISNDWCQYWGAFDSLASAVEYIKANPDEFIDCKNLTVGVRILRENMDKDDLAEIDDGTEWVSDPFSEDDPGKAEGVTCANCEDGFLYTEETSVASDSGDVFCSIECYRTYLEKDARCDDCGDHPCQCHYLAATE